MIIIPARNNATMYKVKDASNSPRFQNFHVYDTTAVFWPAIDFIRIERHNIAIAPTAYVNEGPKVQYEAQASNGPIARPSCPEDLNLPKALPFASSGCSWTAFPVSLSTPSSHCNDANEVRELTTVAEVNARQTAAAWRNRTATVLWFDTKGGTRARNARPITQKLTPRRAILPSPILGIARRVATLEERTDDTDGTDESTVLFVTPVKQVKS